MLILDENNRQNDLKRIFVEVVSDKGGNQTPFISTGLGKQTYNNRCCKVLITNDPRRLDPQPPVGTGAGLGPGIGNRSSRLNYTSW